MTKQQTARLKSYIAQTIAHPKLSNIEKMDKVEEFIDKVANERVER